MKLSKVDYNILVKSYLDFARCDIAAVSIRVVTPSDVTSSEVEIRGAKTNGYKNRTLNNFYLKSNNNYIYNYLPLRVYPKLDERKAHSLLSIQHDTQTGRVQSVTSSSPTVEGAYREVRDGFGMQTTISMTAVATVLDLAPLKLHEGNVLPLKMRELELTTHDVVTRQFPLAVKIKKHST